MCVKQSLSAEQLSIEERADAEVAGFADSAADIQVQFCMVRIDDGRNKVAADLHLMI